MPRGGYRPGSGPKKGAKYKKRVTQSTLIVIDAAAENLTPLEYMLRVMNDPKETDARRAWAAQAAAPYIHPRAGEGKGKKDEAAEKAAKAASGKFAPGKPPLRIVK